MIAYLIHRAGIVHVVRVVCESWQSSEQKLYHIHQSALGVAAQQLWEGRRVENRREGKKRRERRKREGRGKGEGRGREGKEGRGRGKREGM